MCLPPNPTPAAPFDEHFLVFCTLIEGRTPTELAVIADALETLGAVLDAGRDTGHAQATQLVTAGGR